MESGGSRAQRNGAREPGHRDIPFFDGQKGVKLKDIGVLF